MVQCKFGLAHSAQQRRLWSTTRTTRASTDSNTVGRSGEHTTHSWTRSCWWSNGTYRAYRKKRRVFLSWIATNILAIDLGMAMFSCVRTFSCTLGSAGVVVSHSARWVCYYCSGFTRNNFLNFLGLAGTEIGIKVHQLYAPDSVTRSTIQRDDILTGILFLTVALTSLTATLIVCLQIFSHTTGSSRIKYKHIVDILIQSSASCTAIIIGLAIVEISSTGPLKNSSAIATVGQYLQSSASIMMVCIFIFHIPVSDVWNSWFKYRDWRPHSWSLDCQLRRRIYSRRHHLSTWFPTSTWQRMTRPMISGIPRRIRVTPKVWK